MKAIDPAVIFDELLALDAGVQLERYYGERSLSPTTRQFGELRPLLDQSLALAVAKWERRPNRAPSQG